MSEAAPSFDDPITFAVIKNAMDAIVDEVAYTVIRTARSEIVKDVMDYSAAICDAKGEMVAQAKTIAQHLGAIPEAMAAVQAKWSGRLHPGDAVILNDPYSGGMHLPDIFMFYPIFDGTEILAWSVVICHHTDVGGRVPGSNAADSTEIYQEGLRIPPLKLFRAGVIDETLEALIKLNVRVPDTVFGDLLAQYAACQAGAREIGRLVARYGVKQMRVYMAALLDYAERMARSEIATWPQGTFRFTDYIDSDGISDDPVPSVGRHNRPQGRQLESRLGGELSPGAGGDQLDTVLHEVEYVSQRAVRIARRYSKQRRCFPLYRGGRANGQRTQSNFAGTGRSACINGLSRHGHHVRSACANSARHHAGSGRGRKYRCLSRRAPCRQPALHHRRHDQRLLGRASRPGRYRCDYKSFPEPFQYARRGIGASASRAYRGLRARPGFRRCRAFSWRTRLAAILPPARGGSRICS